jgi:hypothetical protein
MHLKDIIEELARSSSVFRQALNQNQIQKVWQKVMDPEMAKQVWVAGLQELKGHNTLLLETNSAGWGQQLVFMKKEIIEKMSSQGIKINAVSWQQVTGNAQAEESEVKKQTITVRPWQVRADFEQKEKNFETRLMFMEYYANEYAELWQSQGLLKCSSCGRRFNVRKQTGICVLCAQKNNETKENKIKNLLKDAPWIKPEEAMAEINISEDEFSRQKEKMMAEIRDRFVQGIYEYEKTRDLVTRRSVEKHFIDYTLLKTALTPDVINDKIIEQAVGPKIYKKISKK